MAGRMSGCLQHARGELTQPDHAAFGHRVVDQRNALSLVVRSDHAATVALLQVRNAAGMIAMMMGDENVGELPAGLVECRLDRPRFRSINSCRRSARLVMDENAVIVLQAEKKMGFRGHGQEATGARR